MNNETAREISDIYEALSRQVDRVTAIDDRVNGLEQQALNKDRLIELLFSENERLKKEVVDHLGTIEGFRDLSNDLSNLVKILSNEIQKLKSGKQK